MGMLGKVEEVPANMTLACVRASRAVKTCSVFVGGGKCDWGVVREEEEGGAKMRQTIKRGRHSIYLNLY